MKHVLTAVCSFALIASATAYADPEGTTAPPPKPKSVCLNTGNIDHLSYPDNKTILFHMRGGKVRIWRNDLKHECSGLTFERGIAYEVNGGVICSNMQVVYVINRWIPCMLGSFTPYEEPKK